MRCAENTPDQLAIQHGEIRWSFAELDAQATHLARQLASLGIHEQTRVAVLAHNGLPYVTCVHALTRLGAIMVPLNIRLTAEEHIWQIQDVNATVLLSDAQHNTRVEAIKQALPQLHYGTINLEQTTQNVTLQNQPETDVILRHLINLNDTQAIMYTSGTTGNPKGVIITYTMQWWSAIGSALNLGHHRDDCWLACMPLFHVGGLSILMRSVINGISIIVQEKFDPQAVNKAIRENRVTIISVVAIMLQRMLSALDDAGEQYPETLRCVLLGGGPAPRPLLENCAARSIPVVQTYGLTESCAQAVTLSPADALRKLGSAGRPLAQVQLRIMNENTIAAAAEAGTIYLKGPSITAGYDHRPEATAQTIHDGWLATGDIGYVDQEGYLYVLDRRSDLIISGGENVYPAEIEAVLLSHPDVEEAGVCGQVDPQWGQVPIAFIHWKAGSLTTEEQLLTYAAQRLARYKQPKAVYSLEQLPRNSAGKLLRRNLTQFLPE
jgi:O-succinylbenzoic acid--CoA ligase